MAITEYGWGYLEAHPALGPVHLAELHSQQEALLWSPSQTLGVMWPGS